MERRNLSLIQWGHSIEENQVIKKKLWSSYPLETQQQFQIHESEIKGNIFTVRTSSLKNAGQGLYINEHVSTNTFLDRYGSCYLAEPKPKPNPSESVERRTFSTQYEKYIVNLPEQSLLLDQFHSNDPHGNLYQLILQEKRFLWKKITCCDCNCDSKEVLWNVKLTCHVFMTPSKLVEELKVFMIPSKLVELKDLKDLKDLQKSTPPHDSFSFYANDNYLTYDLFEKSESTVNAALMEIEFSSEFLIQHFGLISTESIFGVYLISIADIPPGGEIVVSYGERYWNDEEEGMFRFQYEYSKKVYSEMMNRIVSQIGFPISTDKM